MKPAQPRNPAAARFAVPPPVPAEWWRGFTGRLGAVSAAAGPVDAPTGRALAALAVRLHALEVVVAFGGYFSAGKSSLLNCGLGRPLLPVDDLPETGAPCVLSAGPRDSAAVVDVSGHRRAIHCNREAIRTEVGLWRAGGANGMVARIHRLELRLVSFPAPPNVSWVDCPGIASGEESSRAAVVADAADVLLWVLKGAGQFLSETEAAALAAHVQRRGPASVVFVINAFLPRDTPAEWAKFLAERLPVHEQRLRDRLELMGFPAGRVPPMEVVSARAAAGTRTDFGGPEFRRLIAALAAPDAPLIRRARLGRAALELRRLAEVLRPQAVRLATDNADRQRRGEDELADLGRRRRRFLTAAAEALDRFLLRFANAAEDCAGKVATAITPDALKRDDTYGRALSSGLDGEHVAAFRRLGGELLTAAQAEKQQASGDVLARLKSMLAPPVVRVPVPDGPLNNGGVWAGAAAGAVAGTFVPIPVVGTVVGAFGGALASAMFQGNKIVARDAAGAQANARAAGAQAVEHVRGRRDQAIKVIETGFVAPVPSAPPPDAARERRLGDLVAALTALADEAGGQA